MFLYFYTRMEHPRPSLLEGVWSCVVLLCLHRVGQTRDSSTLLLTLHLHEAGGTLQGMDFPRTANGGGRVNHEVVRLVQGPGEAWVGKAFGQLRLQPPFCRLQIVLLQYLDTCKTIT